MADFKKQGGSLTGREERYDGFEGEPRAVGGALGGNTTGSGMTGHHGNTTAGPHGSNMGNKMDPRIDSDRDGSRNMGAHGDGYGSNTTGTGPGYGMGHSGSSHEPVTSGYGSNNTGTHGTHDTTGTTGKKPGLMDKLNPKKDADGDGKKGVME